MKKPPLPVLIAAATIATFAAGFLVWRAAVGGKHPGTTLTKQAPLKLEPPPDTTSTDNAAVFQKAFWRRPGEDDRILHAERREWRDGEGVSQWQWFLAVEPSPALVKHLREDNAFGLAPDKSGSAPDAGPAGSFHQAPAWFPAAADGFDVFHSPSGGLRLLFSKSANQLYATDSGHGFRPGAAGPASATEARSRPVSGPGTTLRRLPDSPPPNPPSQPSTPPQ